MNNHEFYVQQEAPRRQRTVETINKIVYDFGKFFSVIAPEIGNFFSIRGDWEEKFTRPVCSKIFKKLFFLKSYDMSHYFLSRLPRV